MADERDFELLDDYLTNRLSEQDRSAFEQQLQADPDLQHEYTVQKRVIKGIKDARVAELKSMLNQVPIPAHQPGNSLATKILLGSVITLMIAAAGYFYFNREKINSAPATVSQEPAKAEQPSTSEPEINALPAPEVKTPDIQQRAPVESDKNQTSAGTEHSRPSLAKKPDPLQAPASPPPGAGHKAESSIPEVQVHSGNSEYDFHYKISNGTISLYGPFDAGSYELIHYRQEGNEPLIALYHKGEFYVLDDKSGQTKPLTVVSDAELARALKSYQGVQ